MEEGDQRDALRAGWIQEQLCLREQVIFSDAASFLPPHSIERDERFRLERRHVQSLLPASLQYVGGLDISYDRRDEDAAIAVLAVLHFPSMRVAHMQTAPIKLTQPYMPSFLAFREAEHLIRLVQDCPEPRPQLLFVDGNGRLHAREAGLGVAVGVKTDLPTIAVAKTYQPVKHAEPGVQLEPVFDVHGFASLCRHYLTERGDWLPIPDAKSERVLGGALLSSPHPDSVRPIFVSSGHRVGLGSSLALTLACCTEGRVPEPVRQADLHGRELLRQQSQPVTEGIGAELMRNGE